MSTITKIKNSYQLLSRNEKKVADYLLENTAGADSLTVGDLATKSNTSPSCIIRFTKKLGYDGYTDFRLDIAKDLGKEEFETLTLDENFTKSDSISKLIKKLHTFDINTVNKTYNNLNEKKLEKAINIIKHSSKILVVGEGLSQLVGADLARKFMIIGLDAICHQDAHIQLTQVNNLTKDDCLILISYSGKTNLTNIALKRAKAKGVSTISISRNISNYLTKNATIPLFVPTLEQERKIGSIASRFATSIITDILYLGVVQDSIEDTIEHVMETRGVMSSLKNY